jgi:hypothetical protein
MQWSVRETIRYGGGHRVWGVSGQGEHRCRAPGRQLIRSIAISSPTGPCAPSCGFISERDNEERRLWIEAGEKLAEHNLEVWKQYGPAAQHVILEELGKMEGADIDGARPLLTGMLAQVLSAELGGTTWRFDSVTIHQGAVPASEELRQLRGQAIGWLEGWLDNAKSDAERLAILQALGNVDAMPMQGGGEGGLFQMLLEDGARVARLILDRAPQWGLELRRGRGSMPSIRIIVSTS